MQSECLSLLNKAHRKHIEHIATSSLGKWFPGGGRKMGETRATNWGSLALEVGWLRAFAVEREKRKPAFSPMNRRFAKTNFVTPSIGKSRIFEKLSRMNVEVRKPE
jgi:hypothetical protein